MTERFIVDDAGTLIDMQTRNMFDIVEEACPLLNEQHETIERLKQNIDELLSVDIEEELLKENKQLKEALKELKEIGDYQSDRIQELDDENEQLKQRNNRQAKQLDRLYSLIAEKDWRTLSDIMDDFKRCEEQLQREWRTYE